MSNQEFKYSRIKNVFDLDKLRLFAERLPEGTGRPAFMLHMVNGNLRFKVFTNCPTDKNDGQIAVHMDLLTFSAFLVDLKDFIDEKIKTVRVSYNDYTFFNRQRSENVVEMGMLIVEKDEDSGRYFIALVAKDRPKIKFFFKSPIYHKFHGTDGTQVDKHDDSRKYLRAYYELLKDYVAPAMVKHSDEAIQAQEKRKEAYKQKMEQRGGSQQYQQSNSGHEPSKHGGFNY